MFTAYGAGNILLLAALCYAVWGLLRRLDTPLPLRMIALLMLLTPYSYTQTTWCGCFT